MALALVMLLLLPKLSNPNKPDTAEPTADGAGAELAALAAAAASNPTDIAHSNISVILNADTESVSLMVR